MAETRTGRLYCMQNIRIFRLSAAGTIGKETEMDNENNEMIDEMIPDEEADVNAVAPTEEFLAVQETAGEAADMTASSEPEEQDPAPALAGEPVPQHGESRKERKAREKEEARLEKERAKQQAKEEKAAARAAKRAEIKYRNIPAVIILSLLLALFVAALGYLGWEYIGARSMIDSLNADKAGLGTEIEELVKSVEEKEAQISDQLSQIEEKNALISDGDAAVKEISGKVAALEDQVKTVKNEAAELLEAISHTEPLGVAYSGDFYADRSIVIIEDGESIPLNISALYGQMKTAISYTYDDSTKNIDSVSLSQDELTGGSGLITLKVKRKTAGEDGLAVLKFENDHSEDFFYIIVIVR